MQKIRKCLVLVPVSFLFDCVVCLMDTYPGTLSYGYGQMGIVVYLLVVQ